MSVIGWVVLVVIGAAVVWYFAFTDEGRGAFTAVSQGRKDAARARHADPQRISEIGAAASGGVLTCPVCGGTQFVASRKLGTKLAFGAASMLGQAKFVRCVTCGTRYRRG